MVSFKSTAAALVSVLVVSQGVEAALPMLVSKMSGGKRSIARGEDALLVRANNQILDTNFKGCLAAIKQGPAPQVKPLGDLKAQIDGLPTICSTEAEAWNRNPEALKVTQGKIVVNGPTSITLDGNQEYINAFDGKDE